MSARKRHTAALDYMRQFILWERCRGNYLWSGDMIEKLVKRGWLEWNRPFHGSYSQRRNYIASTALGRRAVYVADRHATPSLRRHHWDLYMVYNPRSIVEHEARLTRQFAEASRRAARLHATKIRP